MGYQQIIWTLYNYQGSNADVLEAVKKFKGNFAITMTKQKAESGLSAKLAKQKIPVYVHTINSIYSKKELKINLEFPMSTQIF